MDPGRPEPMSDEALDREIAAALNVEASPAFVAGVRHRIAHEPVPSGWRESWKAAAAAVLAIAIMGTISRINLSGPRNDVTRRDKLSRQAAVIESRTLAGMSRLQTDRQSGRLSSHDEAGTSASMRRHSVAHAARRFSVVSGFSRTDAEILIDVREANALRALFAGASMGQIDLAPLATAAAMQSDLQPPGKIVIAPLTIPPLAPAPGEGARP